MPYTKTAKLHRQYFMDNIDDIINLYKQGTHMKELCKMYNVDIRFISKVFIELGLKKQGVGKYIYNNEDYFDNIDSQNKAYILGLLFADGCNHIYNSNGESKYQITLSLQEEDKEILEKIKVEMILQNPLHYIMPRTGNCINGKIVKSAKPQWKLEFNNKHMSLRLSELGMVQNKSLVLQFPNIDSNLYRHFIRGYFDGDGSVYSYMSDKYMCYRFKIVSSRFLCLRIKEIIQKELCINLYLQKVDTHNGGTYTLTTVSNKDTKEILDWIYKDADLYMERKHNKFISYFYNINNSLLA